MMRPALFDPFVVSAALKADLGIQSITEMRDPIPQPNVVSAVRSGGRPRNPRLRRRILGALLVVAVLAVATVALASERHVRGWAAVAAGVGVLTIMIAWLAGASRRLSSSERDPRDFSD